MQASFIPLRMGGTPARQVAGVAPLLCRDKCIAVGGCSPLARLCALSVPGGRIHVKLVGLSVRWGERPFATPCAPFPRQDASGLSPSSDHSTRWSIPIREYISAHMTIPTAGPSTPGYKCRRSDLQRPALLHGEYQ